MGMQAAVVVGTLACVAFVAGLRNLVDVVRHADERQRPTVAVLVLLAMALGVVVAANPEVWPLFVVGFPSLALVVLEAWAGARGHARRSGRGRGARNRV